MHDLRGIKRENDQAVIRSFKEALDDNDVPRANSIRRANPDLVPAFNYIRDRKTEKVLGYLPRDETQEETLERYKDALARSDWSRSIEIALNSTHISPQHFEEARLDILGHAYLPRDAHTKPEVPELALADQALALLGEFRPLRLDAYCRANLNEAYQAISRIVSRLDSTRPSEHRRILT